VGGDGLVGERQTDFLPECEAEIDPTSRFRP
jgi:hypothetical protein